MTEYNKQYYQDNRAKIIAEQTARNKENEEAMKRYMKKYYANNRDKLLNYAKKRNRK